MLEHGGTDLGPAVRWDFSTNANAIGPVPTVRQAVQQADRQAYPEPSYAALRAQLAPSLGVVPARICPTAGNAEAIRRLSLAARLAGVGEVWLPQPGYGDYAAAAHALGLAVRTYADLPGLLTSWQRWTAGAGDAQGPVLIWLCEPCNPTGAITDARTWQALSDALTLPWARAERPGLADAAAASGPRAHIAIDRAYEPLRLDGADPVPHELAQASWQLWSPNKALGLTGVRGGVMVAPAQGPDPAELLHAHVTDLAPSWVLSAEGVAMLQAWVQPHTQRALHAQRTQLAMWMQAQTAGLEAMGWAVRPSCVPFHLARLPVNDLPDALAALAALRHHGIKLRDASGLGLPGWVRLRAMPAPALDALRRAWASVQAQTHRQQPKQETA